MDVRIAVKTREQMAGFVAELQQGTEQAEKPEHRRSYWRLSYVAPGTIKVDDVPGGNAPIYITTRDISADGLGFMTHDRLPVDQKLLVTLHTDDGDLEMAGTVVRSVGSGGISRFVGVAFDFEDD